MTRLLIDVTEEDIKAGIPKDSSHCPIALAATRAIIETFNVTPISVEVEGSIIFALDAGEIYYVEDKVKFYSFIESFDSGYIVEPFMLEVFAHLQENNDGEDSDY